MAPFKTPTYPGINLDDNYGPQLNTIAVAFMCLSFTVVIFRFLSRVLTKIRIGLDDWLVIVAAVLSWAFTAGVIYQVLNNFYGQHIGKSDLAHVEDWLKGFYSLAILYPMALTASKLSLLACIGRIFTVGNARIPMAIATALNVAWMVGAVLVGIFSCHPIEGFWSSHVPSACINEDDFFLANQCFTIVLDLIVLLMPIFFISQIKASLSQRISICSTFALGLVVTVVSAIRLWQLVAAQQRPGSDPTFNEIAPALWGIIELNVWVIVASIPALRPLFTKVFNHLNSKSGFIKLGSYSFIVPPWKTKARSTGLKDASSTRSNKSINLPVQYPHDFGSTASMPNYSVHVAGRKSGVNNPSGACNTGRQFKANHIELETLGGIRVDHEYEVSRPKDAYTIV